jgi:hypothetical protein
MVDLPEAFRLPDHHLMTRTPDEFAPKRNQEPVNPIAVLRRIMQNMSDQEWEEFSAQFKVPVRLINRDSLVSWLKEWAR